MDNRTIEEVRNNETALINEIKELENINDKLSSALTSAEEKNKKYKEVIDKAINELFNLKDIIYRPETGEKNIDVQRKISSIITGFKGVE